MRMVIVHESELREVGYYIRREGVPREDDVVEQALQRLVEDVRRELAEVRLGDSERIKRLAPILRQGIRSAYRMGIEDEAHPSRYTPDSRAVYGLMLSSVEAAGAGGPLFERGCVSIYHPGHVGAVDLPPHDSPLFNAAFPSLDALESFLRTDGSRSSVHVVGREAAARLFRRFGGGVIEAGTYLLHPKRSDVLVPMASYRDDLKKEMLNEFKNVIGRLGAQTLRIVEELETDSHHSAKAEAAGRGVKGAGGADQSVEERTRSVLEQTWHTPTFVGREALTTCVWIQDHADLIGLVERRLATDLGSDLAEFTSDMAFGLSLDVSVKFNVPVAGSKVDARAEATRRQSTKYLMKVEFFPKTLEAVPGAAKLPS